MPSNNFSYQGVIFRVVFSHPQNRTSSKEPCRALVTPRNPQTGELVTKAQLYGGSSDQPVNCSLYGKDEQDIYTHKLETAAAQLITRMAEKNLLPYDHSCKEDLSDIADLGTIAINFKDIFFSIHRSEWKERTRQEYSRQYDVLVSELAGIRVKNLDQEAYKALQNTICLNSLKTARKMTEWTYGNEPPASAGKRMAILYTLVQDLKQVEALPIPVIPTRYNSKPSRQDLLLARTDSARSLPMNLLQKACEISPLLGQAGLLADTGLRISEATGLLFDSIREIETSQGTMYYLVVNGQIQSNGKRTEITKTDSSYRVVPISRRLGEFLIGIRRETEAKHGNISLRLICGRAEAGGFRDGPDQAIAWYNEISDEIPALLRSFAFFQALTAKRLYIFDEQAQNRQLRSMLTCHSLRRNFCTGLYCFSGLDTPEIYRQMGHTYKPKSSQAVTGLTPEQLRLMCLRKHVSHTLYHKANPLRYSVGGPIKACEVPACTIELILPPETTIELIVRDTEPRNVIRIAGDGVDICCIRKDCTDTIYTYALLASEEQTNIVRKRKLFDIASFSL